MSASPEEPIRYKRAIFWQATPTFALFAAAQGPSWVTFVGWTVAGLLLDILATKIQQPVLQTARRQHLALWILFGPWAPLLAIGILLALFRPSQISATPLGYEATVLQFFTVIEPVLPGVASYADVLLKIGRPDHAAYFGLAVVLLAMIWIAHFTTLYLIVALGWFIPPPEAVRVAYAADDAASLAWSIRSLASSALLSIPFAGGFIVLFWNAGITGSRGHVVESGQTYIVLPLLIAISSLFAIGFQNVRHTIPILRRLLTNAAGRRSSR